MLDFLKDLNSFDYDSLLFMPGPEKDSIKVEGHNYKDPGETIIESTMGFTYHIILFKETTEGKICHEDLFDAVLIEPLEYMSRMISDDWYGMVARKTTTSYKFVKDAFDKLQQIE